MNTAACVRGSYGSSEALDRDSLLYNNVMVSGPRPSYLPQASFVIVSGFRAALDLDTYPLSILIRPQCAERAKPGRGKPVLIMQLAFSLVFTPYLSNAVVSAKSPHYFYTLVALKLLVSAVRE